MAEINFPDNASDLDTFEISGKVYTYNAIKNLWTGVSLSPTVDSGIPIDSLGALSNVNLNSVQAGQLFYYNGTNWINAQTTIDDVYLPASQRFSVSTLDLTYKINEIDNTLDNPDIVLLSGTTIAFKLNTINHPFKILDNTGADYNSGLTHVAPDGTISTGAQAQGKELGTLYWQIPYNISGVFSYICSIHSVMTGNIYIRSNSDATELGNYTLESGVLKLDLASSETFVVNINPDDSISSIEFNHPAAFDGWSSNLTLIIKTSINNIILWQSAAGQILWANGIAPTIENGTTYIIKLLAVEGGTTYYATLLASGTYEQFAP